MKSFLLFVAGAVGLGAVALGIGYATWPDDTLVQGGAAFALAFVPAALTLAWVLYSYHATPEMKLMAAMGGSGFRLMVAVGGGFFLAMTQPDMFAKPFWCWLVLFYMTFVVLEISLLVWQQPKLDAPPKA